MSEEEIKKQYANRIVNADEVIEYLINKFKIVKSSIDIQQARLIIDYLLTNRELDEDYIDKLQKENEQLKEENFDQVYMKAIADYKEKIRNKISQIDEEYSKTLEKELSLEFHNINAQRHEAMKMVLEELLGGDE